MHEINQRTAPHIVMLIENLSFPMDRRMRQEASALRQAGYEVSVICPRGESQDRARFEILEGIRIHRYPLWQAASGAGYLAEYSWAMLCSFFFLLRIFVASGFDIIHAANPPDLFFLLYLPFAALGKKFVYDQHDLCPETFESKFQRRGWLHRRLLQLEQCSYRAASLVIAPNQSFYDLAAGRGGVSPDKLAIVRSGPDLRYFARTAPQPALKRGFDYLVVYLGVMSVQDGVDRVLLAARHLQQIRGRPGGENDVGFVLIGKGDQWEGLRRQARDLGLGDSVAFTGRIPDPELLAYLSTADVCIAPDPPLPLNHMSTMNKIMEYMACAKPIVSFDLVESRRSAGAAAVYVEADDSELLAREIDALLADPERRQRMGEYGFRRVCSELDWSHSAASLIAAYARLQPRMAVAQAAGGD